MAAESKSQRRAAAIAEHHPEKLYKRNRGLLKMSRDELHKYASTKEGKLPEKKKKKVTDKMKKMNYREFEKYARGK